MSRRLAASLVVAASLLPCMPVSHADGTLELPRAFCDGHRVDDPPEDAVVNYGGTGGGTPVNIPNDTSKAQLDILNVDVRLTDTKLETYLHIKNLGKESDMSATSTDTEYSYIVTYSFGTHNYKFTYNMFNPGQTTGRAPDAPKTGTDGTQNLASLAVVADDTLDYVVWSVDRSEVETKLGSPLAEGDKFTAIKASTQQATLSLRHSADDTTAADDDAAYTVGDDYCFGPPPAGWGDVDIPASVQFTDTAKIVATLQNEDADPLTGKTVELMVAGEPKKTATTNADGDAIFNFTPTQGAGTYAVTLLFPGDATDGKTKTTGTIKVTAEATKFAALTYTKAAGTARTVVSTLTDNDNHPVVGQKVDWYVNGKKVATLVTDAKGKTTYKGAKAGQSVYAKYNGLAGKFLAATAKPVKLG